MAMLVSKRILQQQTFVQLNKCRGLSVIKMVSTMVDDFADRISSVQG